MIRKLAVSILLLTCAALFRPDNAAAQVQNSVVVSNCGTPPHTYSAGSVQPDTQNTSGNKCTAASVSASVSGFTPNGSYGTPLSVSNSSSNVALPTGTVVYVMNTGSNAAYVNLGSSSVTATTSDVLVPAGGGIALTVGTNTYIAGITASSTTSLNLIGGAGLGNAFAGGGSGGSGGGAVYGPTAVGSPAANPPVLMGGTANAGATGNVQVWKVDSSGNGQVAVTNTPTVTANAGTNLNTSALSTSANQPSNLAQEATTSGATANESFGCVTTSAPSYTTAKSDCLSLTTGGALRSTDASAESSLSTIATNTTNAGTPTLQSGSTTAVTQGTASNLNAEVVGAGTAGSPSGGVVSVQGVSSMTPLLVTPSAPADPCFASSKSYADFESTSSGGSIITAQSSKKAYICAISIVTSAAANVSIIEGTGSSVCTGGTTAGDFLNTGTTAANGASFAANGGINTGNGTGTIFANATANQNTCVLFSTTNSPQINVHVSYVQQ